MMICILVTLFGGHRVELFFKTLHKKGTRDRILLKFIQSNYHFSMFLFCVALWYLLKDGNIPRLISCIFIARR